MSIRKALYIAAVCSLCLSACDDGSNGKSGNIDSTYTPQAAEHVGNNIEVIFADSGFTKAVLRSKLGMIYEKKRETRLTGGVVVDFMSKTTGKKASQMTSENVLVDDNTKNMRASGNVVVVDDSTGTRLETEVLNWNNSTEKLHSDRYVVITTPYERLTGYGFESDLHLKNYKILKVSGIQGIQTGTK
ncbi:MAG: LPS export ABC transporter periplasmic protein LptC [Chloroflexota bacterium]